MLLQQVDLRDEEAVRLGLHAPARVPRDAPVVFGAHEPIFVGVLAHVALDGFQALEVLHHVVGLRVADEGGPVLVPYLVGQRGEALSVVGGADGVECDAHGTATFRGWRSCVFPYCNAGASCLLQDLSQRVNSARRGAMPGQSVGSSNMFSTSSTTIRR